MKVTDVIVQCLENEGAEYVFGIIGTETLDLAESLSKSTKIQYVNVRHEQGAAFMADVYGRIAKKAGVCLSTLGPGASNLLTGIASAQLDHSPIVALIGQAGLERQHKESHQYIDIVQLLKPVTKWCSQIHVSQTAPTMIRKAFRTAKMDKPGAAAVTLPENLASQMIPNQPLPVTPLPEIVPTTHSIITAQSLIEKHVKPFIIIGNGVIREAAVQELQTFVETLKSPAIHSFMAKGVLPKEHPNNYYTFGFKENDLVLPSLEEADLLIVIGYDFVEKLPKDWNQKKLPVLHIDSLPAEINEYYPVEAELVGNLKITLQMLNNTVLPAKPWEPMGKLKEKIQKAYQIKPISNKSLTVETMLHCIEQHTSENTIVISDVGAHKVSIAKTYQPKKPNGLIISNGLASMGIAVPGAVGAKLAAPNDTIICVTGDGGALMNFAEIETAKRLGLSFIIILLNDSMLQLEVQQMNQKFGQSYGADFKNPDFVKLAESFGIKGRRASTLADFDTFFKEALNQSNEIFLIDAVLESGRSPLLQPE
ncbi:acetolactate synthase large subunit [Neobacillus mesonae]|uniref:acetolactate synthase large subunit n=1 Tax=Neobacillus mesonae TaxID=1193713 RepID=UPI002040AE46|nr:acetolactate synthase large subunit [Neobacillus mesonae]MCM3567642.1 acetolactate synthase large subunit [Neobacillus mesonae]